MSFNNSAYTEDTEEQVEGNDRTWVQEIALKRSSPSGRSLEKVGQTERLDVAVIGSGDFGRALAGRLAQSGFSPTIGSRDPNKNRNLIPSGVEVADYDVACKSEIIIIAIPQGFYHTLPADLLSGKILVDVSNRSTVRRTSNVSQAEYLASLFPNSTVVKGFNVLSAYALESGGIQGSKQVFVAGDSAEAKSKVCEIVRGCGFVPVDLGALQAARTIEDIPVAVFPSWKKPFLIHLILFIILYTIAFIKYQICWPLTWSDTFLWELWNHIPMDNINKTLSVHALISLALCYLPGVLAAWLQIIRGTKYSRFPNWLDQWLKMRKQLGLLMLFAASIHACISVAIMGPLYQQIVYGGPVEAFISSLNDTVKIYGTEKMDWRGELFLITGVFGFGLVCILGLTSLPSVTQTLSWKEFAWIQSGLGWTSMWFLCAHDMFYGWPYINSPSCGILSSFQYSLYIPGLTILLKIPLVLPPLSGHLSRIRSGYVRSGKKISPA